jgi:hypothetical protein
MTLYIINAPVLTNYGLWEFTGPLAPADAQQILSQGFISAIGHEASAQILSDLLHIPIPTQRIRVAMQAGDQALIFRLLERLPEGKILTLAELQQLPFELGLLQRIR